MAGDVVSLGRPMRPDEFEAEVRKRAAPGFEHMVMFTDHAVDQMVARGITRTMAFRVLRRGSVNGTKLERDEAHANWIAPMIGITAGVEVSVICAIRDSDLYVVVVTAHPGRA